MHLLVLGGSLDHLGGVEAFCDRSKQVLEARGGHRIDRIPTSTAFLTLRRMPGFLEGLRRLVAYRGQRPDCVWLQYVNLPDLAYLMVAKGLGMKVMVTPHLGKNWRSQSNAALRGLSGKMLERADRLALISPTQELEIALPPDVPRSRIRNFLPEYVLGEEALPEKTAPELQLIHSGRLSAGKGTFLFVEVCNRLKRDGIPFHARITGAAAAETLATLNKMIADYGLEQEVAILGRVSDAELLELLRASDVLVHLSVIDSYPLIVLESMACGAFPVCIDLAGARDMVETYDGAVVSESGAVAETVAFLKGHDVDELRRRGRAAGAKVKSDYSWENCGRVLEAALEATVQSGRPVQSVG